MAHQQLLQRRRMGHDRTGAQLGQVAHHLLDMVAVDFEDAALALSAEVMDEAVPGDRLGGAFGLHLNSCARHVPQL